MTEGPLASGASRAANSARVPAKFLLRHNARWGRGGDALDPGRRDRPADPGRRARCRCSGRGGRWGLSEKAARLAGARPAGEEQCRARGGAGRRGRGCLPQAARPRHVGPLECAARRSAPFNSAGSPRPPTRAPPRSTDVTGVARGAGGGHAGGARAGERRGAGGRALRRGGLRGQSVPGSCG